MTAPFGQRGGDVGTDSDPDLNEAFVPAEPIDESRFRVGVHVGIFINSGT